MENAGSRGGRRTGMRGWEWILLFEMAGFVERGLMAGEGWS